MGQTRGMYVLSVRFLRPEYFDKAADTLVDCWCCLCTLPRQATTRGHRIYIISFAIIFSATTPKYSATRVQRKHWREGKKKKLLPS